MSKCQKTKQRYQTENSTYSVDRKNDKKKAKATDQHANFLARSWTY